MTPEEYLQIVKDNCRWTIEGEDNRGQVWRLLFHEADGDIEIRVYLGLLGPLDDDGKGHIYLDMLVQESPELNFTNTPLDTFATEDFVRSLEWLHTISVDGGRTAWVVDEIPESAYDKPDNRIIVTTDQIEYEFEFRSYAEDLCEKVDASLDDAFESHRDTINDVKALFKKVQSEMG